MAIENRKLNPEETISIDRMPLGGFVMLIERI
jgi:hypothetical protein